MKKYFLPAVFILVLAALLWIIFSPKEDISHRIYRTLKEQEKQADLAFKKVTFEEVQGQEKFWQLEADSAVVNKSTGLATLQKANGLFYKNGRPTLKFLSPAALWDMQKKEIYLDRPIGFDLKSEKNIMALLKSNPASAQSVFNFPASYQQGLGYWFQANNLSWKLANQKLVCTGGLIFNKGEITGRADTLKGDVAFNKVLLEGSPIVTLKSAKEAPVTLEAKTFELQSDRDLLIAQGYPVAVWQTAKITAQAASYDQRQKKLRLTNRVILNYKDINAWGDSAEYLINQQAVLLSGNARAEQGERSLTSDRVLVSLKDQKISLLGKSRVVIPGQEIDQ